MPVVSPAAIEMLPRLVVIVTAVSAALAYLARGADAKVAAKGHGIWQLVPAIFDSGPAGDEIRDAYARGEIPVDDD